MLREVAKRTGSGIVLIAPIEVRLPGIAQPVQPDVLFVSAARQRIVLDKHIEGSPDLIVEVTSPSTARADRKVKLDAYERAGVQEYWIANPRTRFIEVYVLARGEYGLRGEYGPGDKVSSEVLPELDLAAEAIFPPLTAQ
jgi:Uma2 family endonuclease